MVFGTHVHVARKAPSWRFRHMHTRGQPLCPEEIIMFRLQRRQTLFKISTKFTVKILEIFRERNALATGLVLTQIRRTSNYDGFDLIAFTPAVVKPRQTVPCR